MLPWVKLREQIPHGLLEMEFDPKVDGHSKAAGQPETKPLGEVAVVGDDGDRPEKVPRPRTILEERRQLLSQGLAIGSQVKAAHSVILFTVAAT
jgi:hypothetical protein